jgi:hypothetical protein
MTDEYGPAIRLTMRLSPETKDELYKMCDLVGVKPTFLLPIALLVGMRTLVKTLSLEDTVEMWKAAKDAGLEPNHLLQALSKISDSDD